MLTTLRFPTARAWQWSRIAAQVGGPVATAAWWTGVCITKVAWRSNARGALRSRWTVSVRMSRINDMGRGFRAKGLWAPQAHGAIVSLSLTFRPFFLEHLWHDSPLKLGPPPVFWPAPDRRRPRNTSAAQRPRCG